VGKRPYTVCGQLRTANDKTPNGQVHRVLGWSNRIWCPYADDMELLRQFESDKKERTLAS